MPAHVTAQHQPNQRPLTPACVVPQSIFSIEPYGSAPPILQSDAESYKFIIVAPDSWSAGPSGWQVPLASGYPTFDMLHIQVPSRGHN